MAQLLATFPDLVVLVQDAIHGPDRTEIEASVEQFGVDFRRSLIDEPGFAQHIEHGMPLVCSQRPGGLGTGMDRRGRPPCRRRPAMEAGARKAKSGASRADQAGVGRQGRHGVHQDVSTSGVASPSSEATFFWISMTASARCKRSVTPVSYTH